MQESIEQIRRRKAQFRQEAMRRRAELPNKDHRSLRIWQRLLALPEFQAARTILFYVHYGDEVRTQALLRWLLGQSGSGPLYSASDAEAEAFGLAASEVGQPLRSEAVPPQEVQAAAQAAAVEGPGTHSGLARAEAGQPTGNQFFLSEDALPIGQQGQDRCLFVPYCQGEQLKLFRLRSMAELAPGVFGILEPRPELRQLPDRQASMQEVDLVVVPGVAFDRQGGRLGHGRGYYDRLLAQARPDSLFIGLAYECQMVSELPLLPSDVRMHLVITEAHIYKSSLPRPHGH